ncbi:alpha/beta hydrolase [Paractinoplanes ferrugineus]|nr:alpha/beta hydrolase [Actinoplanes ferrugineus]
MRVPADWADPAGPGILLTIARRPALDPAHRLGALLVNPGGPGGSAVDFTFDAPTFFGEQVRKQFDIVGMDPRGVGRSSPVLCSQDLIDAKPSPLVETAAQYTAVVDYNRKLAADCAARTGPVFPHVDTASVVRDVEAVRLALGEPQINFYGASYGSLIGEMYAERYPTRLRALVLDGVMDHSANVGTFLVQETDAAQDSFREFVAWCARDAKCVLRGQDIDRIWADLMVRARAGTLRNPYDKLAALDPAGLAQAAFSAFYEPQWYSFAYYLRDAAGLKIRPKIATPAVDIADHSFPAVICADWYLPITGFPDLHRRLSILAARAPQMLASPLAIQATVDCIGWPNPPTNPQHRFVPPAGMPAVLLIGTRHDPATTYVWAQRMAQQLGPKASLLTYEGWGHVNYNRSPCVAAAADKYLISLLRPAPGASCPPIEPQPFGVG